LNDCFLGAGRRPASNSRMTAIHMGYRHDFSPKFRWNSFRSVNPKMQTCMPMARCARRKRRIHNSFYFAWNAPQDISQADINYSGNSKSDLYRLRSNIERLNVAAIGQQSLGESSNFNGRYARDNWGDFDRVINHSRGNDRGAR
jgi:hypothetical protein